MSRGPRSRQRESWGLRLLGRVQVDGQAVGERVGRDQVRSTIAIQVSRRDADSSVHSWSFSFHSRSFQGQGLPREEAAHKTGENGAAPDSLVVVKWRDLQYNSLPGSHIDRVPYKDLVGASGAGGDAIDAVADAPALERLEGRGRLLVRYSGTEPLARVMIEGNDADEIRRIAEEVAAKIRSHLA